MKIILLLLLTIQYINAQKLALVIGNNNYSEGYLSNPINDARLIAKTLREVGFDIVTIKTDLERKIDMENVLNDFARTIGKNDTVVIYYSGHGVQYNGKDYLMPIKANIVKKGQLPSVALNVNFLLGGVSGAKLAIVMLDACRNNPYRSFVRNISKGLGQSSIHTDGGMIISYATEANQVANDGKGYNSPYALALSKYMKTSLPVETVFKKVRGEVKKLTSNEQKPMTKLLFDGDFVFTGSPIVSHKIDNTIKYNTQEPEYDNSRKNTIIINGRRWQDEIYTIDERNAYANESYKKTLTWTEAKSYCSELVLDGHSSWRLPTTKELKNLYKYKNKLKSVIPLSYWASNFANGNYRYYVGFMQGYTSNCHKSRSQFVRCVSTR